jgi:hypothetical protein
MIYSCETCITESTVPTRLLSAQKRKSQSNVSLFEATTLTPSLWPSRRPATYQKSKEKKAL